MSIRDKETAKNMIVTTVALALMSIGTAFAIGVRDYFLAKEKEPQPQDEEKN